MSAEDAASEWSAEDHEWVETHKKEHVTVCASCKRACCWQGILFCEQARSAGTKEMTVHELVALALEHPSWWREG